MDEWKKKVSFRDQNFAPTLVSYISNNKVRIEFSDKKHCEVAKQKASAIGSLKVDDAKLQNPRVVLKGISKKISPDEVADIVLKQNDWSEHAKSVGKKSVGPPKIEKCFVLNNRNGDHMYNIVLEVSPHIHRAMMEMGRVNLDHQRVHAENHSRFKQCKKCLGFRHTTSRCQEKSDKCSHCGSDGHNIQSCQHKSDTKKIRCFHCHQWNKKNSGSEPTDHRATDTRKCCIVKEIIHRVNTATDYGY